MGLADWLMTLAAFVGLGLGLGASITLGALYVLHKSRRWWPE